MKKKIDRVLNFWFEDCNPKDWFKKDKYFDYQIKKNFGYLIEDAALGYLNDWQKSLDGSLALIILTDQFTRNVFRGTPRSFSGDMLALRTCLHCLCSFDVSQQKKERSHFILIPLMHSENLKFQEMSMPLFRMHTSEKVYQYALKHKNIIARFGRFPHRNIILGRAPNKIILGSMVYCGQYVNGNQPNYSREKQFVEPNHNFNKEAVFITQPEKEPNSQA